MTLARATEERSSGMEIWITYDVLIRRLVRAFLAALAAGVPARELAAVEATSDAAGKFAAVGEG